MSTEKLNQDEAIVQFCGVTGADEERARGLLEACEWNLELAINMHVDTDPEGRSRKKEEPSIVGDSESGTSGNLRANPISADDDDDISANVVNSHLPRSGVARQMARRSVNPASFASTSAYTFDSDGVRPPIAPVRQILNPNPIGYPTPDLPQRYSTRSSRPTDIYDAFRDFRAEAEWQEMALEGNSNTQPEGSAEANGTSRSRTTTLQELFRPPLDLVFRGSLTSSREAGQVKNKWMLVNIQNSREFACQILNRDVWSNQAVKDIVKEHFIFWQVYHDSYEGQRYVQFYNVRRFPHVAIIDPRTGELMISWPTTIDHNSFCDSVIEFLTEHPSPDGSGDANTMKKLRIKSDNEEDDDDIKEVAVHQAKTTLYDQSEEAQLEAAIKASLTEAETKPSIDDTIEIDEDTIEAFDTTDPQIIARDRELIERSPSSHKRASKPENYMMSNENKIPNQQQQQRQSTSSASSVPASHMNHTPSFRDIKQEPEADTKTTAESLSAAVANQQVVKIDGPECKIALRFPDGSSLVHTFSSNERLSTVRSLVQMEKSTASSVIEFIAPPNRKLTDTHMNETLKDLGLCPASRLEVKCAQD